MTEFIFPAYIEFSRKVYTENIEYKIIIDFRQSKIISKAMYNDNSQSVIADCVFEESTIEMSRQQQYCLGECLNFDRVNLFLNYSSDRLEKSRYGNGRNIAYTIDYGNKKYFTGALNEIYNESPFEEAIDILKNKYSCVKYVGYF